MVVEYARGTVIRGVRTAKAATLRAKAIFCCTFEGKQDGAAVCLSVCLVDAANDDEMIVSRIAARVWANQIRALIGSFNLQILSQTLTV